MWPKATKADLLSTHDIRSYIHNAFLDLLKELKGEIQVCLLTFYLVLFLTILLVLSYWTGLNYNGHMVH